MSNALAALSAVVKPKAYEVAAAKKADKLEQKEAKIALASSTTPQTKEDKFKALKAVEASLNKQFNTTNSLVRSGDRLGTVMPHTPTGITSLDYGVIGIGGIPDGRIIEIYGMESAGKTTLALELVAEEQRVGNLAAFVDAEHALDFNYAQQLGVDVKELTISQPDSGEQAIETVVALVESRAVSIIVVDSVAALVPQAELDGEMGDSHMGLQARLMSQAMRKLRGICAINGVKVVFINQIRNKIGVMFGNPETTTGGMALKFYASLRLEVRRIGGDPGKVMSGGVLIGHKMKIKAVKNKVGSPFNETIVDVIYGKGIDRFADLIGYAKEIGVIEQAGAWYRFEGENIGNGIDKTVAALRDQPEVFARIKDGVQKAIAAQREVDTQ